MKHFYINTYQNKWTKQIPSLCACVSPILCMLVNKLLNLTQFSPGPRRNPWANRFLWCRDFILTCACNMNMIWFVWRCSDLFLVLCIIPIRVVSEYCGKCDTLAKDTHTFLLPSLGSMTPASYNSTWEVASRKGCNHVYYTRCNQGFTPHNAGYILV